MTDSERAKRETPCGEKYEGMDAVPGFTFVSTGLIRFRKEFIVALNFLTDNPSGLLAAFKKAIDKGHVATWAYDHDGDFTHTATQWKNSAWLRRPRSPGSWC
jgi:hypothetical protein